MSDPRISVYDARVTAPPCKVLIRRVPLFGSWIGTCECGKWRTAVGAGNAFGWFKSESAARSDAERHLATMDAVRVVHSRRESRKKPRPIRPFLESEKQW